MNALAARRSPAALLAWSGMLAASAGDFAQGYDGPGPFVFLAVALAVLLVPRRPVPLLASAAAVFFLVGAAVNSHDVTATLETGGPLAVTGVAVQLAGLAAAAAAAVPAVRGRGAPGTARRP
ncbi:hypothetical protein [Streptomyces sp. NPDC003023]|uniref:hypothetical protein n=1 Tax=Streptomyces sp. NPDC003023 TaxID=3364675 RepID=UPI0036C070C8